MSAQSLREGLELLAETLQGGSARRLPSGRIGPKLGGPQRLATLFPPASPDPEVAADFRERHEWGMRAEVFNAVTRWLERWAATTHSWDPAVPGFNQMDFDDCFVALTHLRLLLRDRRDSSTQPPVVERLADLCQATLDAMAETWLQSMITAKLNAPDPM